MNSINQNRRTILKGALAVGAVGAVLGKRLAYANQANKPVWPKEAFNANTIEDALFKLTGGNTIIPRPNDILIKAPTIAENGLAHITIQSNIPDTESISIAIPNNPSPLVANFILDPKVSTTITTRIKIENTGDIVAIITANNKLYSAKKRMRITAEK